jgi:hypothetical protein
MGVRAFCLEHVFENARNRVAGLSLIVFCFSRLRDPRPTTSESNRQSLIIAEAKSVFILREDVVRFQPTLAAVVAQRKILAQNAVGIAVDWLAELIYPATSSHFEDRRPSFASWATSPIRRRSVIEFQY